MKRILLLPAFFIVVFQAAIAQVSKTVDLDQYPPQWIWKQDGYGNQWNISRAIQNELQRILKPLPNGMHATFSIAYGDRPAMTPGTPRYYECYLMLKKFSYNPFLKKVEPEGETGCWIYFQMNTLNAHGYSLPGLTEIKFGTAEQYTYVCNLRIEKDANGNRVLYIDTRNVQNKPEGYCFSANGKLPVRRLTRKELFTAYKQQTEKKLNDWIGKYETSLAKDEAKYKSMTPEQKKAESYWPDLLQRNRKSLEGFKQRKAELLQWYNSKMQTTDLEAPAVVETLFENMELNKLDVKEGFNVWIDDPSFFDKTKPQDAPQFLFLKIRRQDSDLPKKLFMDRFYEAFNLDVLCGLTGEPVKKAGSINTLTASLNTAKTETKKEEDKKGPVLVNFEQDISGSFPERWYGMKNVAVQEYGNSKWLALNKAGYWYPRQFNKKMEDGFNLSFSLEWNKDISYYSGLFAVTLAEMEYDNVMEGFRTAGNQTDYYSFYDGYAVNFNRVILYFDPYFNSGGQLQVMVMDRAGAALLNQKILLPAFYKEKNQHRLTVMRKGRQLLVQDNGTTIAAIDGVFGNNTAYNAYFFSRYRANNEFPSDTYYLNNIEVNY